jgi:putative ABC transport system permease protein
MRLPDRMSDLAADVTYALRRLRQAPGFGLIALLTLGLGSGATTAIFSVVNAVVLRPVPIPRPEEVVRIYETNPSNNAWTTSEPNYLDFRDQAKGFTAMAAITGRGASLLGRGDPVQLNGAAATATYFTLFGDRALLGAPYGADQDRVGGETRVVLLSEGIWKRLFGSDPKIVGTLLDFDGVSYRVAGVMPAGYGYLPSDFWVPMAPDPAANRGSHLLTAFGRLKPGVTLAAAQADLAGVAARLSVIYPKSNGKWGVRLESFADWIVGPSLRREVLVLFGAVGFVLLLACANVANLLLARATGRQREISLRVALGAGRGRIVRQLLTESALLSLLGGAVGLGLAAAALPLIRTASPGNIPRLEEASIDLGVLAFTVLVSAATGILFGLAPALHAADVDLQQALKQSSRSVSGPGRRTRDVLVVAEVALAVVLLVGAGLLGRSFVRLQRVPTGFEPAGVVQLTVTAPNDLPKERRGDFFRHIEDGIAGASGVRSVGASSIAPFSGGGTATQFLAEGHDPSAGDFFQADWRSVTPGFFKTLGIALVRGRLLEATDVQDHPHVVVIDETMARRLWPGGGALGRHVMAAQSARGPGDQFEVVGVVRDIREQSLATDPGPAVYYMEDQKPWIQMTFFIRTEGSALAALDGVRHAFREAAPATPVPDILPLTANFDSALAPQRFTAWLLGAFAIVALTLAAVGLYGIISYSVALRVPEMGVRLALGAAPGQVAWMVVRGGASLALLGVAIGSAAAAGLSRLLASLLFDTAPTDALTYGLAALLLLGVAVFASYLPARRAGRVDPLTALRAE